LSAVRRTPPAWIGPLTRSTSATARGSAAITPSMRTPVVCWYRRVTMRPTVGMSGGMFTADQARSIAKRV
jgi:hypothetical protein